MGRGGSYKGGGGRGDEGADFKLRQGVFDRLFCNKLNLFLKFNTAYLTETLTLPNFQHFFHPLF